jgi:hypothetical protein
MAKKIRLGNTSSFHQPRQQSSLYDTRSESDYMHTDQISRNYDTISTRSVIRNTSTSTSTSNGSTLVPI